MLFNELTKMLYHCWYGKGSILRFLVVDVFIIGFGLRRRSGRFPTAPLVVKYDSSICHTIDDGQ